MYSVKQCKATRAALTEALYRLTPTLLPDDQLPLNPASLTALQTGVEIT